MNHIKITQENGQFPEPINWQVLEELGDSLSSLDNESDIIGSVTLEHAYEDTCTALRNAFQYFIINVTNNDYYIRFQDSGVESLCASQWGTNGKLTLSQAAAITEIPSGFFTDNYRSVTSFNELGLFGGNVGVQIDPWQFKNCTNLTSIDLRNVTKLYQESFSGTTSLAIDINIPRLNFMNDYVFFQSGIISVSNLGSITRIPECTFYGCTHLTSVVLPSNLDAVASQAFQNSSLSTITGYNGIKHLGNWCFGGCSSLTEMDISSTVEDIGEAAFCGCTSLTSFGGSTFTNLRECGAGFFMQCTNLTGELYFPNLTYLSESNYGCWFTDCQKVTKIKFDKITRFCSGSQWNMQSRNACWNCKSLRTLDLGPLITKIEQYTFGGDCSAFEAMVIRNTTPPTIGSDYNHVYFYGNNNSYIYVPDAAMTDYSQATGWSVLYTAGKLKPLSEYEAGVLAGTLI